MIAVDPAHQRKGIGEGLTALAVEHIRSSDCKPCSRRDRWRPRARAGRGAYERAGFTALPLVRYYKSL